MNNLVWRGRPYTVLTEATPSRGAVKTRIVAMRKQDVDATAPKSPPKLSRVQCQLYITRIGAGHNIRSFWRLGMTKGRYS